MFEIQSAPELAPARPGAADWRQLPGVRTMTAARAALQARLGAGCMLALWPERAPDARMRMSLYADDDSLPPMADWRGALQLHGPCGAIELADGARWLRALTGIDLGDEAGLRDDATHGPDDWLCGAVLGGLDATPLAGCAQLRRSGGRAPEDAVVLRWVLHSGRHSVACHARASAATWCALLARADWRTQAASRHQFPLLPISSAIVLARHALPHALACALRPGDIILPDAPVFGCDGHARLRLGGCMLRVAHAAPNHLEILDLEHCMEQQDLDDGALLPLAAISHTPNPIAAGAVDGPAADEWTANPITADAQAVAGQAQDDALAGPPGAALLAVPVTLDFLLGRVQLPLGRLQQLAVGSVLELTHGSPAAVSIDCGGRLLGQAEVLDVEGRLGLRVTRWGGAS